MTQHSNQAVYIEAMQSALHAVDAEEAQLDARRQELREERRGLQLALNRAKHQGPWVTTWSLMDDGSVKADTGEVIPRVTDVAAEGVTAPEVEESGTFTASVAAVLGRATRPISPKEITDMLVKSGLPLENTTKVRGAISYLARQDRVYAVGRGAWVLRGSAADRADIRDQVMVDLDSTDTETPTADAVGVSEGDGTTPQEGGARDLLTAG